MCLTLQMGKLRSRFKDSLTAGEDHNSDLPEGSLRAKAVLHFPFIVSTFIAYFWAQALVRC